MDKQQELIVPSLSKPPQTPLPQDLQPPEPDLTPDLTRVLRRLKAAGQTPTTTSSGLSVVTSNRQRVSPSGEQIEKLASPKKPIAVNLPQEVSTAYLTDDLKEAIYRLLQHQEFKRNTQVSELFTAIFDYLKLVEKELYPSLVLKLQRENPEVFNDDKRLRSYLLEFINHLGETPDENIPQVLKEAHQKVFSLIQSSSYETIEQLFYLSTQLISSTKDYGEERTERVLKILSFLVNQKGRSERKLLLPNSSALGSLLVDALRNQLRVREQRNWDYLLSVADWIDFGPSDADEFLCFYLDSGLSVKNDVIARLALMVEAKYPEFRFAKEQEKRRQAFAKRFEEAKEKGYLDIFLSKTSNSLINQIVFAIPPINYGQVGFEVEGLLVAPKSEKVPLFPLPYEFYFTFEQEGKYIEIKPGLPYIKDFDGLKRGVDFLLWWKRNSVFKISNHHIHLDKKDFPLFPNFLKDYFIFLVINHNSLGTHELREWLPPYNDASSFINRLLIGSLSQQKEIPDWQINLFGLQTEMPFSEELFESNRFQFFRNYVINQILNNPGGYLAKLVMNNTNEKIVLSVLNYEVNGRKPLLDEILNNPGGNLAYYVMANPNKEIVLPILNYEVNGRKPLLDEILNNPGGNLAKQVMNNPITACLIRKKIKELDYTSKEKFIEKLSSSFSPSYFIPLFLS